MSFMRPELVSEDFVTFEDQHGDGHAVPEDVFGNGMLAEEVLKLFPHANLATIELVRGKCWGRLTAPGYMDCTDWSGPFDDFASLAQHMADLYPCEAVPSSGIDAQCTGIDGHEGPHLFVVGGADHE